MRGRTNIISTREKPIYAGSTWKNGTEEEIKAMLEDHYSGKIDISDYMSIGDERVVNISSMSSWNDGLGEQRGETHEEQGVVLVIVGFNHDNLASGINGKSKAAISLHMKEPLIENGVIDGSYLPDRSFEKSWETCARRTNWINTTFKESLPDWIKDSIKTVRKVANKYFVSYSSYELKATYQGKVTTIDDCYLLSLNEIGIKEEGFEEGETYEYYSKEENRKKSLGWWTRTPSGGASWVNIEKNGTPKSDYCYSMGDAKGIAVGFSM